MLIVLSRCLNTWCCLLRLMDVAKDVFFVKLGAIFYELRENVALAKPDPNAHLGTSGKVRSNTNTKKLYFKVFCVCIVDTQRYYNISDFDDFVVYI